jgi:DNA repair protein RecO (recombination protein O)
VNAHERTYKTHAIVLRARNLGEADKIYTLFTNARGKVDAIAKGVRRPRSQVAGKLEFMSEAALTLHRGRNLDVITSAEIERAHWPAITAPAGFATAHLIAELVDAFCEHELPVPEVYALLRGVLRALENTLDPATLVPRFELRLLGALGLAPAAECCVRCDATLDGVPAWADLEAGGLACESCRPHRADALSLSAPDVANFRGLAAPPRGAGTALRVATPAAGRAVDAFVTWHLGKRPKASKLLDDLAYAAPPER